MPYHVLMSNTTFILQQGFQTSISFLWQSFREEYSTSTRKAFIIPKSLSSEESLRGTIFYFSYLISRQGLGDGIRPLCRCQPFFLVSTIPGGLSPVNGQRICTLLTGRLLTIRWPRNDMNKKSKKKILIVLIMILRYILSMKVSELIQ